MSKFNVGDKVRVIKTYEPDNRRSFIGRVLTIQKINCMGRDWYLRKGFDYFSVVEKDVNYIFYEDELELVERKSFTKSDIKDGMVVEFRDGDRRIVLNGHLMTNNAVINTSHFTEDLQHQFDDFTIDKVYTSNARFGTDYFKDEYLDLIWEREPEYKEMTVSEIEEKLGYKIKVISDD